MYQKSDFESFCKTIDQEILNQGKYISIDTLLNIYQENVSEKKEHIIWKPGLN